jgi:AmiR/NasT family two-component response regulator
MNTLKDRIRSTKAQFRIAVKQYNQSQRLMERLKKTLEQLEKKDELARAKSKAKHADRG